MRDLREEIGDEDLCEVVSLFMEEVEEVIERLKTAPDPARFEADLHFLRGSSLNLGFADLGALCGLGEKQAAAGMAETVDIDAVTRLYSASKQEFVAAAYPDRSFPGKGARTAA